MFVGETPVGSFGVTRGVVASNGGLVGTIGPTGTSVEGIITDGFGVEARGLGAVIGSITETVGRNVNVVAGF